MMRTYLLLTLAASSAVLGSAGPARAQVQVAKLTGSDSGPLDLFGDSASASGDTVAVGAKWHMDQQGAVYVFRRDVGGADQWGQVCKLLAPDGLPWDKLGCAVCLDGDTLIAGAYGHPGVSDIGAAYVFQRSASDPNQWDFVKELTASDGAADDLFGFAVALSGDTALVGAYTKNVAGVRSGATYVFERNLGGPNQWGELKRFVPSDAGPYSYFGVSIGLSGDTAIIGAYWQIDLPGRAYIFERNAGGADNWGQTAELYDHGPEAFGYCVSIDGDTAVVGAYANGAAGSGSGRTYIYQRDQGGPDMWGKVATLAAEDAGPMQDLGWSVAVCGSTALAGAPGHSSARGATYVFRPDAQNPELWEQTARLLAADGAPDDLFGYSVALSGNLAIMGAQQDDDQGDGSGSAYVFYLGDVSIPPTAFDGAVSMTVNNTVTVTLTAYDDGRPNPPGVLSYVITSLPANGYLTDPNGGPIVATPYTLAGLGAQVVYQPSPDYFGSDGFTFVANDGGTPPQGGDSNTATISITVYGPHPPMAADGSANTTINTRVTITLVAADDGQPDPPGVLSYVITSLPAHGFLTDPNGGAIFATPYTLLGFGAQVVYQPSAYYTGGDSLTFVANDGGTPPDGGDSNTATISINVAPAAQLVHRFPLDADPGWTPEGQWAFGQPLGSGSHDHDPTSGHTGDNVYGYNLNGDYVNGMPAYCLTTTAIDCSRISATQLRFYRWLGVETYDHATIAVSNDGMTWSTAWDSVGLTYSDAAWTLQTCDIGPLADGQPTVYVRWGMGPADSSVTYPGWNIDDVEIWGWFEPVWVLGDLNCDGVVSFADINPFVLRLSDPAAYWTAFPACADSNGDINGDGTVGFGDINPFVVLLTR
jgi:hypothetical protein